MLDPLFVGLSRIGSLALVWLVVGIALALLWRRPALLLPLLLAVLAAEVTGFALKRAIPRDRPPLRYPEPKALIGVPHDSSFPSVHAATSFAAATVLAFAVPRLAPILYLLAAGIAFSRVYVGVHYPLDVLGGAGLGAVVAPAVVFALRLPRWPSAGRRQSGEPRPSG